VVTLVNSVEACYWAIIDRASISIMFMIASLLVFLIWGYLMIYHHNRLDNVMSPYVVVLINLILAILAIVATFDAFGHMIELINK
jgi:hypothetical protein